MAITCPACSASYRVDAETLGALEEAIENFVGCALVISHDRFFLDRLATHILAFEGDPDERGAVLTGVRGRWRAHLRRTALRRSRCRSGS